MLAPVENVQERWRLAKANAQATLDRLRAYNEADHPRDEHGRWTDAGGSDSAPSAPAGEKLLLVSEQPNTDKIREWQKQIETRIAELKKQDKEQGLNREGVGELAELRRMDTALAMYQTADKDALAADRVGLNAVYDGDGKLLAAAWSYFDSKSAVANVDTLGALDADARTKALEQLVKRYGKAERIQAYVDVAIESDSIESYEKAGFKKSGEPQGGLQKLIYGTEGQTEAEARSRSEHSQKILGASQAAARLLGYNPNLVDVSYEGSESAFTIGNETGQRYAAGRAFLDTGRITVYPQHVSNASEAVSIMAHEVAHQKYETVLKAIEADRKLVMAEPGPPPDPNHPYWWGQHGGTDAVMAADGTLRPPYDKKYPLYTRFVKHDIDLDKRIKSDGITPYSKAYWEQAKPSVPPEKQVTLHLAQHETIAEMARVLVDTGKLEGHPTWKAYYKDIDKTYGELKKAGVA